MSGFDWNAEKNQQLAEQRGISFERVVSAIEQGGLVDVLEHPNQERYSGQLIFAVDIEDYICHVPSDYRGGRHAICEDDHSQPQGYREIIRGGDHREGQNERGRAGNSRRVRAGRSQAPTSGVERELQEARQAARNTFNKTRRVNFRMIRMRFQPRSLAGAGRRDPLSDPAVQCHPQVPGRAANREELARR